MNARAQLETSHKSSALKACLVSPYYHMVFVATSCAPLCPVRVVHRLLSLNNEKTAKCGVALEAISGSDALPQAWRDKA